MTFEVIKRVKKKVIKPLGTVSLIMGYNFFGSNDYYWDLGSVFKILIQVSKRCCTHTIIVDTISI